MVDSTARIQQSGEVKVPQIASVWDSNHRGWELMLREGATKKKQGKEENEFHEEERERNGRKKKNIKEESVLICL